MNQPAGIIESIAQRIESLEQLAEDQARDIAQLRAEVAWRDGEFERRLHAMYKQGRFDAEIESTVRDNLFGSSREAREVARTRIKQRAQQHRDEIVERAKEDVQRRFIEGGRGVGKVVWGPGGHNTVEFVVNKEKRTIVAVLKLAYTNSFNVRGIAKCHPNDCFNVHIGKAIALRRALGLEVPDEYLNAPQPTEVREGDKILYVNYCPGFNGKVETVRGFNRRGGILTDESDGCIYEEDLHQIKVIDDSREGVTAD